MRTVVRRTVALVVCAIVAVGYAYRQQWFGLDAPSASGPARDVALGGGAVSDGGECGAKNYHYFRLGPVMNTGGTVPGTPAGPQLALGSYGAQAGAHDPAEFTISLSLDTGSASGSLELSAPLGRLGVAVEIEGPDGLVGGAHDLPVTLDDASDRLANGRILVGTGGTSAEVTLPSEALCPGYDVVDVDEKLDPPADATGTITGQPPYTLTVSISDPAIAAARTEAGSTASGPVLAADNLVQR